MLVLCYLSSIFNWHRLWLFNKLLLSNRRCANMIWSLFY